ncbi:MAG: UDP-2,3-diacylglucosamine diphosphatase LpxI [Candidatus Omnitrophica bacterium]|nr:UDP-2,3-diacylglucosamine diphosphatase LpxI [Candidatus Omnitrophota bacterium]
MDKENKENKKNLGLIAGNGKFPFLFAREARRQGCRVTAVAIKGDTSILLTPFVDKIFWSGAGELKKLFEFFKSENIEDVVMAGQVSQRNLFDENLPIDEEFKNLFDAIKDRKADTIFSAIADALKQNGMMLLDSTVFLKDYLASKGTITKRGPSQQELDDIEFGVIIAKQMGELDVGQTVVIKDKAIVAIEAMEGTDQAILRGGRIAQKKAVVVKASKPNQDLRFDVPVVGARTIKNMIKAKASCLAIEAGKTIVIDEDRCLRLANKHNICIVGI